MRTLVAVVLLAFVGITTSVQANPADNNPVFIYTMAGTNSFRAGNSAAANAEYQQALNATTTVIENLFVVSQVFTTTRSVVLVDFGYEKAFLMANAIVDVPQRIEALLLISRHALAAGYLKAADRADDLIIRLQAGA